MTKPTRVPQAFVQIINPFRQHGALTKRNIAMLLHTIEHHTIQKHTYKQHHVQQNNLIYIIPTENHFFVNVADYGGYCIGFFVVSSSSVMRFEPFAYTKGKIRVGCTTIH